MLDRRCARRWATPLLVALTACLYPLVRQCVLGARAAAVPAPAADRLRVISWNLRNFPGSHDHAQVAEQLDRLQPQVLALQEVLEPRALPPLRPGWEWHTSHRGGRHHQHLAIGWDPSVVDVVEPMEHEGLSMDGRVRPALSARVVPHNGDPQFDLVVVHLKATRRGHDLRTEQWVALRDAVDTRRAAEPVSPRVLVVGDFNVAGGPHTSAPQEHAALEAALQPSGLEAWPNVGGCSAYWDGHRRDAWWEPSHLDRVFGSGFETTPDWRPRVWSGTHCARHACTSFRASAHHPDPTFQGVSDHCPVVIDLPRSGAD